jgi:hypothetical protein
MLFLLVKLGDNALGNDFFFSENERGRRRRPKRLLHGVDLLLRECALGLFPMGALSFKLSQHLPRFDSPFFG